MRCGSELDILENAKFESEEKHHLGDEVLKAAAGFLDHHHRRTVLGRYTLST